MKNPGDNIKRSLIKQQEALNKFNATRQAFLLTQEEIKQDIENARNTWKNTVNQLPGREFKS